MNERGTAARKPLPGRSADFVVRLLASGLYSGYFPKGSGTAASLVACAAWVLFSGTWGYAAAAVLAVAAGFPLSGWAQKRLFDEPDSPRIVIDEIAGMFVTLAGFSFPDRGGLLFLAAGFVLFRFFDILKPQPISALQRIRGGAGIMLDDIAAGVAANALLRLAWFLM